MNIENLTVAEARIYLTQDIEKELAKAKAAIEAMPTCRCEMSTDDQCQLAGENAQLSSDIDRLERENAKLREALFRLRDCDWVISLPDRMDAVRKIAREALQKNHDHPTD